MQPSQGKSATKLVAAHKHAQDVLGEYQDSVVASELTRRLGAALGSGADRNGFTYGILWAREQECARRARARAAKL